MPFTRRQRLTLNLRDRSLDLGTRTLVMGVLNITPDSFSDGGRYADPHAAASRAWEMVREGADLLDIGGESTRPGARGVPTDEELRRVVPVMEALSAGSYPIPISIDTSKSEVARAALERGARIVNDITALRGDPLMGAIVAEGGAAVVLMHMRGEPRTMQQIPPSPDILQEIRRWSASAVAWAETFGISSDRILLDPGIGFGKTVEQNLAILRNLDCLVPPGLPILVGTSRKSFIGAVLNLPAGDRIWGTAASVAASVVLGAHIVRVHDVAAMRQVADMIDAIVAERPGE
jgi:dihydropteroate synthase